MIAPPEYAEPTTVDVLVHDHDEEECELSTHPGDAMDNTCIHGHHLHIETRDW